MTDIYSDSGNTSKKVATADDETGRIYDVQGKYTGKSVSRYGNVFEEDGLLSSRKIGTFTDDGRYYEEPSTMVSPGEYKGQISDGKIYNSSNRRTGHVENVPKKTDNVRDNVTIEPVPVNGAGVLIALLAVLIGVPLVWITFTTTFKLLGSNSIENVPKIMLSISLILVFASGVIGGVWMYKDQMEKFGEIFQVIYTIMAFVGAVSFFIGGCIAGDVTDVWSFLFCVIGSAIMFALFSVIPAVAVSLITWIAVKNMPYETTNEKQEAVYDGTLSPSATVAHSNSSSNDLNSERKAVNGNDKPAEQGLVEALDLQVLGAGQSMSRARCRIK